MRVKENPPASSFERHCSFLLKQKLIKSGNQDIFLFLQTFFIATEILFASVPKI